MPTLRRLKKSNKINKHKKNSIKNNSIKNKNNIKLNIKNKKSKSNKYKKMRGGNGSICSSPQNGSISYDISALKTCLQSGSAGAKAGSYNYLFTMLGIQ